MGRDTKIVVLVNNLRRFRSVGYFLKALLPEWEKDGREVALVVDEWPEVKQRMIALIKEKSKA